MHNSFESFNNFLSLEMSTFHKAFKEVHKQLKEKDEIVVQTLDFVDKKIVFVRYNGEIDSTFDVQAPDSKSLYDIMASSTSSCDFSHEKICLVGDNSNTKLAVLVNHIAKVIYSSNETKGLVISLSSKIFKSRDPNEEDFDVLLLVLDLVKKTILQ